jgi:hypothetical protein
VLEHWSDEKTPVRVTQYSTTPKGFGGIAKWLRQRSAKPLFTGSNPVAASSKINGLRIMAVAHCRLYNHFATLAPRHRLFPS